MHKIFITTLVCLLVSNLTGCGGGGGSTTTNNTGGGNTITNQPPTISGTPALSIEAGLTYSFTPIAADADNDPLSFAITNLPSWATFDTTTGLLTGSTSLSNIANYPDISISVTAGTDTISLAAFSITVTATAPPVITHTNEVEYVAGTTSVPLHVITNETATCKYHPTINTTYNNMSFTFSNTNSTDHYQLVTGLTDGNSYQYYVRCRDLLNITNTVSYLITFLIQTPVNAVSLAPAKSYTLATESKLVSTELVTTPWRYNGIPATDWPYNPFTIQLNTPTQWPSAPAQGYYYVEPNHPLASDIEIDDELTGSFGRFGYPLRPRKTFPKKNWQDSIYDAGTVVWLKGGRYTLNELASEWQPHLQGDAHAPVWFYGDPSDKPVFTSVELKLHSATHAVIENIQWLDGDALNSAISFARNNTVTNHHITLRNLHFENLVPKTDNNAIIDLSHDAVMHDIVVYNNAFRGNGLTRNWDSKNKAQHGVMIDSIANETSPANASYRIWVIGNYALKSDLTDSADNTFKSLSGNMVKIGNAHNNSSNNHHIYLAGNYSEYTQHALASILRGHDIILANNECTKDNATENHPCFTHWLSTSDEPIPAEIGYTWFLNNSEYQIQDNNMFINSIIPNRQLEEPNVSYQKFILRYNSDPNYPGSPTTYWQQP